MIVFRLIVYHQTIVLVTERFSKMASTLCQKWLTIFCQKAQKIYVVPTIQFCSNFTSMWSKYLSNNVWRDLRLRMPVLATVARKSFNGKFTAEIDFPVRHFMLALLMLTLKV